MSYQVLARKYRPANFAELEGQEHVLRALVNALDNERLHHAYLFTGTRGVGKTTIARILARCLNCETGITSKPCGECNTCREISEGRSVDLIEVDAASRTGVDDMRDLLDNVQYMPTVSRFKVYLIDEVHMLSKSSFNAMLKTLEEPPEHVKFLFATTDPKKLPITVLSRCLQFNLKNLSPEQIVHHLGKVLDIETIAHDEQALWHLGRAADGSMRDALSLADQAISFGGGEVREVPVKSMLGSIDHQEVYEILDAIIAEDGMRLMQRVASLSEFAPDFAALLDDLLSVLHRIAVGQIVPDALDNAFGDRELVLAVAGQITPEQVQLLYQIGLIGQRDLELAPLPRTGFEMVLLRMMAFLPEEPVSGQEPVAVPARSAKTSTASTAPAGGRSASPIANLLSAINGNAEPGSGNSGARSAEKGSVETVSAESVSTEKETSVAGPEDAAKAGTNLPDTVPEPSQVKQAHDQTEPVSKSAVTAPPELVPGNWPEILELLPLGGVTATLATNCLLDSVQQDRCVLKLSENHASLWNASHEQRIGAALCEIYHREIRVAIEVGDTEAETPAQRSERMREETHAQAVADIESDEGVQQLIDRFNGRLDPDSIAPLSR